MIYLDNAATTYPKPKMVWDTVDEVNRTCAVNAGRGGYTLARNAMNIIEETRNNLAKLVGLQEQEKIVFTPSVTIAINQILNGIRWENGDYVYVTPYEHNAVARTLKLLENKYNIEVIEIPIDRETLDIDIEAMKYLFSINPPKCICVNCISNVTGYILPVSKILKEAHKYNSINIIDTAQSLGLMDLDVRSMDVDFIVFAGHKSLYGPFGVGGFIYNSQYKLDEFIVGGTGTDSLNLSMPISLPGRYESSSPNIPAIAGLNAALIWRNSQSDIITREKELSNYAVEKLKTLTKIKLYVPHNIENHIGIISFNLLGYKADEVGMILDQDFNICVRTGYHCAPFIHKWIQDEEYLGTVRISVGYFNTKSDIDKLILALEELVEEV